MANNGKPAWIDAAKKYSDEHIHTCCCMGVGYVRIDAPIGHILFGKRIPCVCLRNTVAKERGERLRRMSGLDDATLMRWSFANFDPRQCRPATKETIEAMAEVKRQCEEYAREPRGWLVLTGDPGTGKTHLAAAIAARNIQAGRQAFFATWSRVLGMLREGYNDTVTFEQRARMLETVEVLVIDDLGAERATEWGSEQLYNVVNTRYQTRRPMVVTSNVDLAQAEGRVDSRILSRLSEGQNVRGWSHIITLPCGDARPWVRVVAA